MLKIAESMKKLVDVRQLPGGGLLAGDARPCAKTLRDVGMPTPQVEALLRADSQVDTRDPPTPDALAQEAPSRSPLLGDGNTYAGLRYHFLLSHYRAAAAHLSHVCSQAPGLWPQLPWCASHARCASPHTPLSPSPILSCGTHRFPLGGMPVCPWVPARGPHRSPPRALWCPCRFLWLVFAADLNSPAFTLPAAACRRASASHSTHRRARETAVRQGTTEFLQVAQDGP